MLSKEQKRILDLIGKIWGINSDQRFGQWLENYLFTRGQRGDKTSVRLFYQEDEDTLKILEEMLMTYKRTWKVC